MSNTSYFVFGKNHVHELDGQKFDRSTVVKITVEEGEPSTIMMKAFGSKWAYEYCNEPPDLSNYPGGIIELDVQQAEPEPEPEPEPEEKPKRTTPGKAQAKKKEKAKAEKKPDPKPEPEPEAEPEPSVEEEPAYEEPPPDEEPPAASEEPAKKPDICHETAISTAAKGDVFKEAPKGDLYIDIETGPLPPDRLQAVIPAFDPSSVALGNRKAEKAAEKIADEKAKHVQKFVDRAALDPKYGMILCIGHAWGCDGPPYMSVSESLEQEEKSIDYILEMMEQTLANGYRIVGFNIKNFDLMFIRRRALIHGLRIPRRICSMSRGRMYWHEDVVDLMHEWLGPNQEREFSGNGLDAVCKAVIGLGKKGDGKHFAELYKADPKAALDYAQWDVHLTQKLGKAIIQDNQLEEARRKSKEQESHEPEPR